MLSLRHLSALVVSSVFVACAAAPSGVIGGDDAASAASAEEDSGPGDEGRDGGAKADGPRDAKADSKKDAATGPTICEQNATCSGEERCTSNDGTTYRYCSCGAGKLACGTRTPAPPSTCAAGNSCSGTGTCAVDDGTAATYCRCTAGAWACNTVAQPDPSCSVDAMQCAFGKPPGATEWMRCFTRASTTAMAAICTVQNFGMGSSGTIVDAVCPAAPATEGAACPGTSSLACGCEALAGGSCVCSCFGTWKCL